MEAIQQQFLLELNSLKERINRLEKEKMIDNRDEIIKDVNIKKTEKEKKEKNIIPLPWLGVVDNDCCRALRVNHGLFTQCENKPITESTFCKTCHNQGTKNGSNLPNSGTVDDRLKCDVMNFADKKSGKKPIPWCQVIKKLNIPMEDAMKFVNEKNITISEEQLVDSSKKRGRPKKDTVEGGVGDESPKKKRGRPRKEKVGVETVAGDDLIASMINNLSGSGSGSGSNLVSVSVTEDEEEDGELTEEKIDDDEDDETEVKKLTIDGKNYLVDNENTVYDMETQEELGFYDKDSNTIIKDGF